jgi:putative transposase
MAHTFTNFLTHNIFSTKERVPTLETDLIARLLPYRGGIFRELDAKPLLINGPAGHAPVLAALPAKLAPAEIIGRVKANASGWVHRRFPARQPFARRVGYAAFGVSPSQKQTVLDYVANPEEHQKKISFKEEFDAFLKKHEIKNKEKSL